MDELRRLLRVLQASTLVIAVQASAQPADTNVPIELTLNDTFIEALKDRATIEDVDFLVDMAHDKANPASQDGDLHVAGRSPERIGLPVVAELMNAKLKKSLVTKFNSLEGGQTAVRLAGVWRIWPEHGGIGAQTQGDDYPPANTTNPEHLFEIHPITSVDGTAVVDTLRPITGFKYKEAESSFQRYESSAFRLECAGPTTTIHTKMIGYNYVLFDIELLEGADSHVVEDGLSVFANVRDPDDGEVLVYKRRIWFVKGSAPYNDVKSLGPGSRLTVVGVPRINLSLVSWRCRPENSGSLERNLPYEMVVVAVQH